MPYIIDKVLYFIDDFNPVIIFISKQFMDLNFIVYPTIEPSYTRDEYQNHLIYVKKLLLDSKAKTYQEI